MKIIECVPNFSEGKEISKLDFIKESVKGIKNLRLLSFEPDKDYNRVVVTLAGDEQGIIDGAIAASKGAAEVIDLREHTGAHPRLGAIDVVPFVPVRNVTMNDCVKLSELFAEKISIELNVPVFLYEFSAKKPERRNLANIRQGEYEGLKNKLEDTNWYPDYGKNEFNEKLGAIVTGARNFLVAYNVNIQSQDIKYAKEIGEVLRESGRPKRNLDGSIVKVDGKTVKEPGRLKEVKGMGVSLEQYNITQVSMNLTNYNVTPIHIAFEEAKKEANRLGVEINGSEIVGLVPLDAILAAGKYYALDKGYSEEDLVKLAIDKLGLSSLNIFNPKEKIIDYMLDF